MAEITLAVAVLAGLASFVAPCILPMIPAFLAYISGTTLSELNQKNGSSTVTLNRTNIVLNSVFFVIGFSVVFSTLGVIINSVLSTCTGGIIGLGETRKQRLELALELARIYPEEVTINMLVPIPGTPLELQTDLPNSEITRMFSVIRFLLPESVIKISGGREINLDDSGEELLQSGANGIITAGYLTMDGNEAKKDLEMIKKIGLQA